MPLGLVFSILKCSKGRCPRWQSGFAFITVMIIPSNRSAAAPADAPWTRTEQLFNLCSRCRGSRNGTRSGRQLFPAPRRESPRRG